MKNETNGNLEALQFMYTLKIAGDLKGLCA